MNVYVIPILIHVPAESAEKAEEFIGQAGRTVFDQGPATITTSLGSIPVLYINAPTETVEESDVAYDTEHIRGHRS